MGGGTQTEVLLLALQRNKVTVCVKTSREELSPVIPGLINLITAPNSTAYP